MQCFVWQPLAVGTAPNTYRVRYVSCIKQEVEIMLAKNRLLAGSRGDVACWKRQHHGPIIANHCDFRTTPNRPSPRHSSTTADACDSTAPAGPACRVYKPCVTYRGCCDCCGPTASQTLMVPDPCDDCCCTPSRAEIPVCLPACCKNPCVSCKCGLFGRGVVTYSYDCGCCVTIVFRNCGDVIVKYSG